MTPVKRKKRVDKCQPFLFSCAPPDIDIQHAPITQAVKTAPNFPDLSDHISIAPVGMVKTFGDVRGDVANHPVAGIHPKSRSPHEGVSPDVNVHPGVAVG